MYKELFINLVERSEKQIDFTNYEITTVGPYGFYMCGYKSINLPNCTTISRDHSFNMSLCEEIRLPQVNVIDGCGDTFSSASGRYYPKNLKRLYLDSVTSIGDYFAQYNINLEMLYIPNATTIASKAFGRFTDTLCSIIINKSCEEIKTMTNFPFTTSNEQNYNYLKFVGNDGYLVYENNVWTYHQN